MQWNIFLFCSVVWLFLLWFAEVCPSVAKHPKHWLGGHHQIHQNTHSTKRFCDPSFGNQTAGAVTQKCGSGFYREWTGLHRVQCVPCSCNELSNECDEHTGNCVNCQDNTTGNRCEWCKEGYYGNAVNRTCRPCPCPFTWSNFTLACLDIGSGVVECLCKHGYSGARCESCAHGYYGDPMVTGGSCKPCNCKDGTFNVCDSLTGECITSGNTGCGDNCNECDGCTYTSLVDLEKLDDSLVLLKQQLQNISHGPGSLSRLNKLEAKTSEMKILAGWYSTAVRHLDQKDELLEADMHSVRYNVSQLTDETLFRTVSDLEKVLHKANKTKLRAGFLLSEAEALFTASQDLLKQLSVVKPEGSVTLSENDKVRMTEKAQHIVQNMRRTGCTVQRDKAGIEQEEAHKLFRLIRNNMTTSVETGQAVLNHIADSVIVSDSSLNKVSALLSYAEETVKRTKGLNLKSSTLQHLQLEKEQSTLLPVTEMTKDLLQNITNIFSVLQEIKKEFENHAAQLDGAKWKIFKTLNEIFQTMAKVDIVTKADKRAEELNRAAAEFQQEFLNATSMTDLLSDLGIGAYNYIINDIDKVKIAANECRLAAGQALKDMEEGGLITRAEGLKDNSTLLQSEARETQSDLKMFSCTMNNQKKHVTKQEEKRESLRTGTSAVRDGLRKIKRDDTKLLIDAAKTAASASNATVRNITERLKNISQEVERITLTSVSVDVDALLIDAEEMLKNVNTDFPVLKDNLTQVEALSRKVPPSANLTESIRKIKDLIEETRNFVNRLPVATSFNGKNYVELHPPKNLEQIKAFTAVDLLLNRHQTHPPKADGSRKRRQDKQANLFVFYLGNTDTSGDYIGMSIRNNVLICVYKLGGVVHEVETGQVTTTTNMNSSDFDRVVFHRVYQDAEVNVTQNFTSQKPVIISPSRNLPNTMTGILDLHPDSVVFYVGGYPEDFTPPLGLRYPKYRGAMRLSYINDNPVCLFNYKHAVNMEAKQPYIRIPQSEVSDYYDGTGYRMAFMKEPDKKKRLFKFHTNSRETNALLFYIGNEESFFFVFVEKGFLVLQGQQADQQLRVQSAEKISLFDKHFAISIANRFIVKYGAQQIFFNHIQTSYMSYFIGGLPAELRQRHNITAPPLRGCVDHLAADSESVEYNRTIGVSDGCPVSLLGVHAATLYSALSVDSLFLGDEMPLRVSLGFRTKSRHGTFLRSSSQGTTSVNDLQLSLADGCVVLNSDNYTLKSEKRYSDGSWHYLSAVRTPTGLKLSIDNADVIEGQSLHAAPMNKNSQGKNFTGCIANLHSRRSGQSFIPADLGSLSQIGDVVLGLCSLHRPQHAKLLPPPVLKTPQKHKPIQAPGGSQCRGGRAHHGEHYLYEEHSWLIYTLPQEDLNHRPHFSFDFKTKTSKGLIFHVAGRGILPILALYIANGKIKVSLGQNRIIQHNQRSNNDNWHRVEFSVERSTFHLLVDGFRVTDGQLTNDEGLSLDLHNPVYLGGDLHSKTTKGHNIPMNSVIGCIRNFKMNDVAVGEPETSHKTLPCLEWATGMGTYFGGGHIVLDHYFTVGSNFVLAFELRPQYLTGLLFHAQSNKTSLSVFLMENMVGVKMNDGNRAVSVTVTPRQSLCDGKFHVVTVSKQREVIRLAVDSVSEQKAGPSTSVSDSTTQHSLFIGGTTKYRRLPVSSPFVGCLRNVKINERPVAFETESRVVDPVNINRCPA